MVHASHFERFIAPARVRPALWRLGLGLVLTLIIYIALAIGLYAVVSRWSGGGFVDLLSPDALASPGGALLVLASFAGMALGPLAAVRLLHRRGAGTLLGRGARVVRDFVVAAGLVLAVSLPVTGVVVVFFDTRPGLPILLWLGLLPLTLLLIGIQTLAEELVFRGYILQQMAARFGHWIAWALVPSLVFGALHYDSAMPPAASAMTLGVIVIFALAAADLTARTGSLGAAWGFHFANNVNALAILALDDTITGVALLRTGFSAHDPGLSPMVFLADAAVTLIAWGLCRSALSH